MKKAAQGKYDEALAIIKENPFPNYLRVCSRYCEQVCTRGDIDSPVAIDEVKRFIAERELKKENRYLPDFIMKKEWRKLLLLLSVVQMIIMRVLSCGLWTSSHCF